MVAWWIGCASWFSPDVETLALPGLQVTLADGFVALDDEALAERLAIANAEAPTQTHALAAARRGPGGSDGLVQIQRSVEPDAARYGPSPQSVLDALEADLRGQHGESGQISARERDGGREICTIAVADGTARHTCALLTVTADRSLLVRAVTCSAPDSAICEPALASRAYGGVPSLSLEAPLTEPGELPRAGREIWGFALGSSREAFRAACRTAGHAVDAYDWSVEPPVVREWFDAGRTSRCDGLPTPPSLGEVSAASAVFDDDRLIGITVFLARRADEVATRLDERYPVSVAGSDQVLHVVDPEAQGDELQSVTLFGAGAEPARLTFLSERGSRGP